MNDVLIYTSVTIAGIGLVLTICNIFCSKYKLQHSGRIHVEIHDKIKNGEKEKDSAILY